MRRENQEIGSLLVEANGSGFAAPERRMVYQGIVSHMVLRTLNQERDVYDTLIEKPQEAIKDRGKAERADRERHRAQLNQTLLQLFPKLLLWFPPLVCLIIVMFNLASNTVLPSPFRPEPGLPVPTAFDSWDWVHVLLANGFALVLMWLTFRMTQQTGIYVNGTGNIVNEFRAVHCLANEPETQEPVNPLAIGR
jgi:hypothetical protein